MKVRAFIALEIPKKILEQLLELRKSIYNDSKLNWETLDKLHVTIKFLGNVDENKISNICSELNYISQNYLNMGSEFTKFGMFYRKNNPTILWAAIESDTKIVSLYQNINESMHQFGFKKESVFFKPHLTMLRLKGNENMLNINKFKNYNIDLNKFNFESIKLMKSELKRTESVYTSIKEFNLNKSLNK